MKNIDDEIQGNVAVLQHLWEGDEGEVKLVPHGNAKKSNVPFTATKHSVKQKLECNLARSQVREAIDLTDEDLGCSIFNAKSPAEHVRNTRQGRYAALKLRARAGTIDKHKKQWDELYSLMTAAKDEDGDFIRSIINHPEPMCLLATDFQLNGLAQSSSDSVDFRPVSIDPTFNNGPFNVTPVSFRNVVLESRRTGRCPVFLGPILIHQTKTFQSYHYLTSQLVALKPRLQTLQAFGTDGEEELIKACKSVFREATALRCFRHFQQNVEAAIKNCGMQDQTNAITGQIFGNEETPGLLEAECEEEFDLALQEHIKAWKLLPGGEKLCKYLTDRSKMMKESMTADVCAKAGLGNPPEKFYTNDSETNNERIKHKMEHREAGVCAFVAGMKQLAYSQGTEYARALCGMSTEFKVRDVFSSFVVPASKWYDMREDQRRSYVSRIHKLAISEMYAASPQNCVVSSRMDVQLPGISIVPENSGLTNIVPLPVLQAIWKKATLLLNTFENSAAPAPSPAGDPNITAFCVHSQSDNSPVPYFVQVHCCNKCHSPCSHVKVTCTCKMYKPNCICSHSVVVAEKSRVLNSFLKWRASLRKPSNFTALATINIDTKSSGKKGNRQRRDRSQRKTQCSSARLPLEVVSGNMQSSVVGSSFPSHVTTPQSAINLHNTVNGDSHYPVQLLSESRHPARVQSPVLERNPSSQLSTGQTATTLHNTNVDGTHDPVQLFSDNMQPARVQSSVLGSRLPSQYSTGRTATSHRNTTDDDANDLVQLLSDHIQHATVQSSVLGSSLPSLFSTGQTASDRCDATVDDTHDPFQLFSDNMQHATI